MQEAILAIDPGPTESALVRFVNGRPRSADIVENEAALSLLHSTDLLAIEGIACYGMPVGAETFNTCIWIGRFIQVIHTYGALHRLVYRSEVKMHLCRSMKAKDANIRQALLDKYGGKAAAIGRKAHPGPLYGIKSHCWSALAVAVTAAETEPKR